MAVGVGPRFGDALDGRAHFSLAPRRGRCHLRHDGGRRAVAERGAGDRGPAPNHGCPRHHQSRSRPRHLRPPSRRAAIPRIDRPVFVVSSPRSGSTLLFETLARARELFTIGGESHRVIEAIPGLHPRDRDWSSNRLEADRRHARASPTRSGVASPNSCATATGSRPTGAAGAAAREDPEELAARAVPRLGLPRRPVRLPLPRPARDGQQHARRLALRPLRHLPRPARLGRAAVVAAARPRLARPGGSIAGRGRHRAVGDRHRGAPRRPRAARPRPVVRHQLRRAGPRRRRRRWSASPRSARSSGTSTLEADRSPVAPHPRLTRTPTSGDATRAELDPHFERVREVAVRAHAVFAAPPRIKPVAAARAPRRAPAPPAAPRPTPTARDVRQRAHGRVPRAPRRVWARRSWCRPTRAVGVIVVRSDGHGLNTHFRLLPGADGHGRPTGRARRRDQGAGAALPEPARAERATRSARRARRLLRARAPPTTPATSASTTWPSPATSSGSVNTRFSCLCDARPTTTASCRGGGRRSSPRSPPRTAATSTAWPSSTARPRYVTALGTTDTAERLARRQDDRRRGARRARRVRWWSRPVHAALAPLARRPPLAARVGQRRAGACKKVNQRQGSDGTSSAAPALILSHASGSRVGGDVTAAPNQTSACVECGDRYSPRHRRGATGGAPSAPSL